LRGRSGKSAEIGIIDTDGVISNVATGDSRQTYWLAESKRA
jgi:hypothetical protein